MNQAIRVVALPQARESKVAKVGRPLLTCMQPSRVEDGCLSCALHRSLDEAGCPVFVEHWANRDAIEQYRWMLHYGVMVDAIADLLADRQVFPLEKLPAAGPSSVDPEPTRPHGKRNGRKSNFRARTTQVPLWPPAWYRRGSK